MPEAVIAEIVGKVFLDQRQFPQPGSVLDVIIDNPQYVMPPLSSAVILDNTANQIMFQYSAALYPFAFLFISIEKNGCRKQIYMQIVTDGVNANGGINQNTAPSPDITGVVLTKDVSAGNVRVKVTSTLTGATGTFKWAFVDRWA